MITVARGAKRPFVMLPAFACMLALFLLTCCLAGCQGNRESDPAGAAGASVSAADPAASSNSSGAQDAGGANPDDATDSGDASPSGDTSSTGSTANSASTSNSEEDAVVADPEPSPAWVAALPEAQKASQLFIVAVDGKSTAQASFHEKGEDGTWQQLMGCHAYIGKGGLGKAREGDSLTPRGSFIFDRAFGIAPDPGCAMTYTQVKDDMYWSGDVREDMHYNQMVSIKSLPGLDTQNSEHLVDFWPEYEYCLNISFNNACTPGEGSAIFLHCEGEHPYTGGCVSIPRERMKFVMQHVKPRCTVIIDTEENLEA